MVIYYVETPENGVSILCNGVGKPFSMRPAADDHQLRLRLLLSRVNMVRARVLNLFP